MLIRLVSGVIMLALLIAVIVTNGPVLAIFTLLISLGGFYEIVKAGGVRNENEKAALPELVGYAGILALYALLYFVICG